MITTTRQSHAIVTVRSVLMVICNSDFDELVMTAGLITRLTVVIVVVGRYGNLTRSWQ